MSKQERVIESEESYDILQNVHGAMMFSLKARDGEPENPKILYDGGEDALFYRTNGFSVKLDYVHPDARESLNKVDMVLVVEFNGNNIEREYDVPVRHVKRLPL
ncbi:MAG: hypothetical protein KAJ75_08700 [Alphaproteobacteria bacterium]|nr:hypothetical protein [Alphaproteobacteria bacterium]